MNKIPWLIDCEKGDLILPGLLGIMIAHSRETYQPTSISWDGIGDDRGIFNGKLYVIHIIFHMDIIFQYIPYIFPYIWSIYSLVI